MTIILKTKIIVDACCRIPGAHLKGRTGVGKAACGILIINEKGEESEFREYLGEMTPPEAEFRGLIFALDQAVGVTRFNLEVWMDSELVVNWMNGNYRMKKSHIRPLFDEAKKLEARFKNVKYFHHNRDSDLAKRANNIAEEAYIIHQA